MGRRLSREDGRPRPAADDRCGDAAAVFGQPAAILHRRRRARLRQFREMGRSREPDRPRGLRALDQQFLHPHHARHRPLLHGAERDRDREAPVGRRRPEPGSLSAALRRPGGTPLPGRFWNDYAGLTPQEALDQLARRTRPAARRLAVIYLTARPEASRAELGDFLVHHLPPSSVDDDELWDLWREYGPAVFRCRTGDTSRAFIRWSCGSSPISRTIRTRSRSEVIEASGPMCGRRSMAGSSRAATCTSRTRASASCSRRMPSTGSSRIGGGRAILSVTSCHHMARAIGSSGDRPDALADLMGIILNDGVRLPNVDLQRLHFAADTPYETDMTLKPAAAAGHGSRGGQDRCGRR